MNKKALVGDTMTWLVAFLIILFALLLFNAAAVSIAKSRSATAIFSSKPVLEEGTRAGDVYSINSMIAILNTNVSYNGEFHLIKELLDTWNTNDDNTLNDFLKDNLMSILNKLAVGKKYTFIASGANKEINLGEMPDLDREDLYELEINSIQVRLYIYEKT